MNLRRFLFENNITVTTFAKLIGVERSYLSRVIHGKHPYTKKLSKKIEIHTGGRVKASSLVKDAPKKKKQKAVQLDAFK